MQLILKIQFFFLLILDIINFLIPIEIRRIQTPSHQIGKKKSKFQLNLKPIL